MCRFRVIKAFEFWPKHESETSEARLSYVNHTNVLNFNVP